MEKSACDFLGLSAYFSLDGSFLNTSGAIHSAYAKRKTSELAGDVAQEN